MDHALENAEKSLELYEKLGLDFGAALSSNFIAVLQRQKNNFDKALDYIDKSLELYEKLGNENYIAESLLGKSSILLIITRPPVSAFGKVKTQ